MTLIADILLMAAAFGSAFYCRLLSSRLKRLANMDNGLGGAISTLTYQVDEMKTALADVSHSANRRSENLDRVANRAEKAARRLEILLAGLHEEEGSPTDPPGKPARPDSFPQGSDPVQAASPISGASPKRTRSRIIRRENRQSGVGVMP